jgi:hypothetical protein
MSERREYYRVRALARVRFQPLEKAEAERLRHALYARPARSGPVLAPEARARESELAEQRALAEALRQVMHSLERIERRLDQLERGAQGASAPALVEISLSGAGFAGPFELELGPDQLVHVELELPGSGLAPISALARPVRGADPERFPAFHFEDIHAEDRELIVQLALRIQSQSLRAERSGETR